ncbi:MAG: choice-of-anchor Q domain-containing protein [Pseudomonadota bacterium]
MKKAVFFFVTFFWVVINADAATNPVLCFSDITSGPRSGNSDVSGGRSGTDGAIVTLWGHNLGNARGSSYVYANGAEAASYYTWGNATDPADLTIYHQMQMISFQISHLAQDGAGWIYVVVNGKQSNSLPFTVRSGNIYFSMVTGNDDTGDGSWSNPWRTIPFAADSLAPGDIAYIGNGVDQTTETNSSAAVNLGSDGAEGTPKALIVYPGGTSKVGNDSLERAFWVWNENTSGYSTHWTIAKFTITTAQVGVPAQTGSRVIGNYVTAPQGDGMDGAIDVAGNNVYILGNELENVGSADCSKLYHAIYVKGVRQDSPPRASTESNREVAWNYVHDGLSNRAINIYSEQEYSAYIQQHRVHDNVIMNQRGDGILLGYYVTGDNWLYNNLIVNAGLGPEWPDGESYHTGLHINTGHEAITQTTVYLYHNTLYGNGWSGAVLPEETGSLLVDQGALDRSTTIHFTNNILYSTGEPYLAGESAFLPAGDYRNCWYNDGQAPQWDTTAINVAPGFVNAGAFNFQLQNDSPCLNVGKDVSTLVARDILGVPRPQGSAHDLGAYECSSTDFSEKVNITRISVSPTDSPQTGTPLTVTVTASCANASPVYYKFYYRENYGTAAYDTTPWTVVQDYSTSNSAQYSFARAGSYIIVARAVTDPTSEPPALPIIGQVVTVSDSNDVIITGLSSGSTSLPIVGNPVTFTATASGPSGSNVYYRFYYRADYGTTGYDAAPWTMVRDYATTNTCAISFPSAGDYIVVARAVLNPAEEPEALPIIGGVVGVQD